MPVQFINESQSPGIRRGGVLNVVRHRIAVICPVDAIPEKIVADLTGLEITDSLHISKITLPEGIRPTIRDRDFTVATIAAPAAVKEEMKAAAEAAAAAKAAAAAAAEAGDGRRGCRRRRRRGRAGCEGAAPAAGAKAGTRGGRAPSGGGKK